jgi:hypothetical protein
VETGVKWCGAMRIWSPRGFGSQGFRSNWTFCGVAHDAENGNGVDISWGFGDGDHEINPVDKSPVRKYTIVQCRYEHEHEPPTCKMAGRWGESGLDSNPERT